MKITKVICSPGLTGFFFDDQKAIKTNAVADGSTYRGEPTTPGFTRIRQPGESIGVHLVLEDGQIASGDCAAVQYSGIDGRDPLFLASDFLPLIEKEFKPLLEGREITNFRDMAAELDSRRDASGKPAHTAIRYGVTQAVLDAVAKSKRQLMAETVAQEYGLNISDRMIPIMSQSGDARYLNADKMILKGVDALPHALINHVEDKLGGQGEILLKYVGWLRDRIESLKPRADYRPVIHLDIYGTCGVAFDNDVRRIVRYFAELARAAAPYRLRIEGPVDRGEREAQVATLRDLTRELDAEGLPVEIVADEWCNTLEDVRYFADNRAGHMIQVKTPDLGGINNSIDAILYCKARGVGAYLGGTCNETHRSAQICLHIAMATSPDLFLAKPGMGVDEGIMIAYNEMQEILALKNR